MKCIALAGNPIAQDAVQVHLQALINGRNLPITVRVGVTTRTEAYAVHQDGGEIWLCGDEAPRRELIGLIDRTFPPAMSARQLGIAVSTLLSAFQVNACFNAFVTATPIYGDIPHG